MHQDLRDTAGDWFYWCFRVRGAVGRTFTFPFTRSNTIGVRGPAVSTDAGKTWIWLDTAVVKSTSFRYSFPATAGEIRKNIWACVSCFGPGGPGRLPDGLSTRRVPTKGFQAASLHLLLLSQACLAQSHRPMHPPDTIGAGQTFSSNPPEPAARDPSKVASCHCPRKLLFFA